MNAPRWICWKYEGAIRYISPAYPPLPIRRIDEVPVKVLKADREVQEADGATGQPAIQASANR